MKKFLQFFLVAAFFSFSFCVSAEPSPEFVKHFRAMQAAVDKNDAIRACSAGKKALNHSGGLPNEAIEEFKTMLLETCQRAKEAELINDAMKPGSELNTHIKQSCKKYHAAKSKCATAGDFDKCMNILAPGIADPGISCSVIK
jgi:hypothetical protein